MVPPEAGHGATGQMPGAEAQQRCCVAAMVGGYDRRDTAVARKTVVTLIDDIDGEAADRTVSFALAGTTYEIDLNAKNGRRFESVMAPWVEAGRKVGRSPGKPRRAAGDVDPKAVRVWAASKKITVPARGRLPISIVEQYRAEGH